MAYEHFNAEDFREAYEEGFLNDDQLAAMIDRLEAAEDTLRRLRVPIDAERRQLVVTDAVYDAFGHWENLTTIPEGEPARKAARHG